ncbi:type II toxin-antitoxin system VapB family antitoxin [candidate division NPL-UPA2 bacterium]|nr:type II toxin-antitoxin system VapB family antitoxin [candidate division NPL-UPA2 bacterium]
MSRTNVVLDDRLLKAGFKLTSLRTKKELVNYALHELVKRKSRGDILKLMGSGCWHGNLDKMRRSRL